MLSHGLFSGISRFSDGLEHFSRAPCTHLRKTLDRQVRGEDGDQGIKLLALNPVVPRQRSYVECAVILVKQLKDVFQFFLKTLTPSGMR